MKFPPCYDPKDGVVPFPTLDIYRSSLDGCVHVHVETEGIPKDALGPRIRVYLNDEVLFENPPRPGKGSSIAGSA